MSRIKPYSGKSLDRLVAELLKANGLHLIYGEDFTFSGPRSVNPTIDGNTQVTFYPLVWSEYFVEQVLNYTRLDLKVLKNLPEGSVLPVQFPTLPVTAHQIIGEINDALGLDLVTDEVEDLNYPYDALESEFKLKVNEAVSYAWLGEYIFDVFVTGKLHLKVAIVNPELSDLPDPQSYALDEVYGVKDILLDLINLANPETANLSWNDVQLGKPFLADGTGIDQSLTKLRVSALTDSKYFGGVEVFYRRYLLSRMGSGLMLMSEDPIITQIVADFLNVNCQAHLSVTDIEPVNLVDLEPGTIGTMTVRSSDESLAWCGSIDIPFLYGLPPEVDKLHVLVNQTLPSPGYL